MKKYLVIYILIVVMAVTAFIVYKWPSPALVSDVTQPGTTTTPPDDLQEITWREYTNDELKISFLYPSDSDQDWRVGHSDAGQAFQATIPLSPNAVIYAYAFTKDYSASKDGVSGVEGYVIRDGKYYMIFRGKVTDAPFAYDEIWKLNDSSSALVRFGKDYNLSLDYPEPPVKVLVNLCGPVFTGIGFVLWSTDDSGSMSPATAKDIETLKKIVTSIKTRCI